jgi:hypothetical protein
MGICAQLVLRNSAQRHQPTVANSVSGLGRGIISSIWQPFVQLGALLLHWRWGQEAPYVSTMIKLMILELRCRMLVKWEPRSDCGGAPWWGLWGRSFCNGNIVVHFNLVRWIVSLYMCNPYTAATQFYPVDSMVPNISYPVGNMVLNDTFQMIDLFNQCFQSRPSTSKDRRETRWVLPNWEELLETCHHVNMKLMTGSFLSYAYETTTL